MTKLCETSHPHHSRSRINDHNRKRGPTIDNLLLILEYIIDSYIQEFQLGERFEGTSLILPWTVISSVWQWSFTWCGGPWMSPSDQRILIEWSFSEIHWERDCATHGVIAAALEFVPLFTAGYWDDSKIEKDLLHWSCNWRQNKNDNKNDPPRRAIKRETGVSELTLCVTTTWVLMLDTKKGEDDDEISNYSITPPLKKRP